MPYVVSDCKITNHHVFTVLAKIMYATVMQSLLVCFWKKWWQADKIAFL
jgi:hypothetical protein